MNTGSQSTFMLFQLHELMQFAALLCSIICLFVCVCGIFRMWVCVCLICSVSCLKNSPMQQRPVVLIGSSEAGDGRWGTSVGCVRTLLQAESSEQL